MSRYLRPHTLDDALSLMAQGGLRPMAGATDLYPAFGSLPDVLDLTAIPALRGIGGGEGLRIAACTTWAEIAGADLPPVCTALQQAARQVGGRQIQNAGTIGGNLCNASPAADGVPPLLVLGAVVELASPGGIRHLPLADFVLGPRKTALATDEILTAVILPPEGLAGRSAFAKLGARAHLVISIASAAARIVVEQGVIRQAAIAVGACSGAPVRLPLVEAALTGLSPAEAVGAVRAPDVAAAISPIDDIRAPAAYRQQAAAELVARVVAEVLA